MTRGTTAKVLLVLVGGWLTSVALAQSDTAEQQLHRLFQRSQSLSGEFAQRLYDREGHLLQTTQGHFVVQRPGNFYWETNPPYEQIVVGNSEQLWIYDPDLEQVTVRPRTQQEQATPARLLSGDLEALGKHYDITMESAEGVQRFTLASKSEKDAFTELRLDYRDGVLSGLSFKDKLGQITQLTLTDVKRNPPVKSSRFQFQPPSGTDVIVDG